MWASKTWGLVLRRGIYFLSNTLVLWGKESYILHVFGQAKLWLCAKIVESRVEKMCGIRCSENGFS